jgi:uncharacterized membrane protein YwaF
MLFDDKFETKMLFLHIFAKISWKNEWKWQKFCGNEQLITVIKFITKMTKLVSDVNMWRTGRFCEIILMTQDFGRIFQILRETNFG